VVESFNVMLQANVDDGILDRVVMPDGGELVLHHRDGVFTVRANGLELISSRGRGSEEALAEIGCSALPNGRPPHVLVGGLGIGYTLRAALDRLPVRSEITVVERFTHVVRWNRELLGALVRHPLDDPRVTVAVGDLFDVLAAERSGYHLILLDVDNGPGDLAVASNRRLYDRRGIERIRSALRESGVLVVWAATPAPEFRLRLEGTGFSVEVVEVPVAPTVAHTMYLARLA